MATLVELGFLLNAALLLLTSALLVYPLVTHARNVAYTVGVVLLALSLFLFTVAYALGVLGLWTLAGRTGIHFVAALSLAAGVWRFAREFVDLDADSFGPATSDAARGASEGETDGDEATFT
ncbi:hypothetical protein G9464_15890 [Halostella sp. JP-L12]|uniref:hypothetical protein n=1 Tax=Halostella TaxID=1843185 RepID=UPI000EF7C125|nr:MULTISPECIES: hypothetical protein [Halostella]NHN49063.1 hypothetical protein [Halostella sp. JP-L12]